MIVELGSRGHYARAVQRVIGVPSSKCDGVIGLFSVAIMQTWQAQHGVEPDGVFGPVSRGAVDPLAFIQAYEGLVLQAYDDAPGPLKDRLLTWTGAEWLRADGGALRRYATIGWGTRIWPGQERTMQRCTRAQADQWLRNFVDGRLKAKLATYVSRSADAAQLAAVSSLGYNGGPGAIVDLANAKFDPSWWGGGRHYATSAGVRDAGLLMRRREEACLYWGDELIFPAVL